MRRRRLATVTSRRAMARRWRAFAAVVARRHRPRAAILGPLPRTLAMWRPRKPAVLDVPRSHAVSLNLRLAHAAPSTTLVERVVSARAPAAPPQPLRLRETTIAVHHTERLVDRVTRLGTRVERIMRERPPAPTSRTELPPRETRASHGDTPHLVLVRPGAPPAPEVQTHERTVPIDRLHAALTAPEPLDVSRLADQVLRVIDRRVVAERERRGHV